MTTSFGAKHAMLRRLDIDEAHFDLGLRRGLVNCLSVEEVAALLREEAPRSSSLRNYALRRVAGDLLKELLPIHRALVAELMELHGSPSPLTRQSAAYCLSVLAANLPESLRIDIYARFLKSRYVGIRRRAYKALAGEPSEMAELTVQAWREFDDPECSWLIVKTFPPAFLLANRQALESRLSEGWQLSRLYLRIAEIDVRVVKALLSRDAISYCYVLAKLGKRVSAAQARAIVLRSESDERFGLLIWALGVMKHWTVLVWVASRLDEVQQARFGALARDGIQLPQKS